MQPRTVQEILQARRTYFQSGATLPVSFRKTMLKKLYAAIQSREAEITAALQADLGKPAYESFMCEVGLSHTESMADKKTWLDLPMRYRPYKKGLNQALLHLFLRQET